MLEALLPVGDTPFAHFQLSWLSRHGVTEVVYSIAVLGEKIRDFVGDGGRWGLQVNYVDDGKELVCTAGALRRVYDAGLLHEAFLVLYGDSFLPFDFRQLMRASPPVLHLINVASREPSTIQAWSTRPPATVPISALLNSNLSARSLVRLTL